MTKDLIYLARMEEGENQTQMIDFPLSEVISETAASFQALARTESKQLTLKIQPMLSFYGDEDNIRRLTSILLDNALKYSDENGFIQLNLEKKGKYIRLLVVNTTRDALNREQLTHLTAWILPETLKPAVTALVYPSLRRLYKCIKEKYPPPQ